MSITSTHFFITKYIKEESDAIFQYYITFSHKFQSLLEIFIVKNHHIFKEA